MRVQAGRMAWVGDGGGMEMPLLTTQQCRQMAAGVWLEDNMTFQREGQPEAVVLQQSELGSGGGGVYGHFFLVKGLLLRVP